MIKKLPKTLSIIIIVLFNICLLIVLIWAVTLITTGSLSFYMRHYVKYNTEASSGYNLQELKTITTTIIDYLFGRKASMQVVINNLDVFSNQALYHMADVKALYTGGIIIGSISFVILVIALIIIIWQFQSLNEYLLKTTLITLGVILGLIIIITVLSSLNFNLAFDFFHKIIFPDPQKYNDAFFNSSSNYPEKPGVNNLMLVIILSEELFMKAGLIIAISSIVGLLIWLIIILLLHFKTKKRRISNG